MALTPLQNEVMAVIAANRSETSYMAGGAVLNKDWFLSDDLDIFHDTDEEIVASARAENYIAAVDPRLTGLLSVDARGIPREVESGDWNEIVLRRATAEAEAMPQVPGEGPAFAR